jgi:gluconolactonase
MHKLAEGFAFTEGPVWVPEERGGHLLFSDPNRNTIYRYAPGRAIAGGGAMAGGAAAGATEDRLEVFRTPSGYSGGDIGTYKQPGSNGLTLDPMGRLVANEHGNRRVTRTEADGSITVLLDRFEGRRLNSPNDLVFRSDGTLFVTDPPFGLPEVFADPRKELPWSGVFALAPDGSTRVVTRELDGPNGVALSPDERYLYVGNWDEKKKVVMRYELAADGSARRGEVFFDLTAASGEDAIDGIKVDRRGDLYVSGPGGLWVISPEGKHLGTIKAPRHVHNLAWGDDGRTLYLCARDSLYRMRLGVEGVMPPSAVRTSMKTSNR